MWPGIRIYIIPYAVSIVLRLATAFCIIKQYLRTVAVVRHLQHILLCTCILTVHVTVHAPEIPLSLSVRLVLNVVPVVALSCAVHHHTI